MSDCGEDLLVDLSEILFNELAFFRLMQNLDTSNVKFKEKLRTFAKVCRRHFLLHFRSTAVAESLQTLWSLSAS